MYQAKKLKIVRDIKQLPFMKGDQIPITGFAVSGLDRYLTFTVELGAAEGDFFLLG